MPIATDFVNSSTLVVRRPRRIQATPIPGVSVGVRIQPPLTIVEVSGEVDASNADLVHAYVAGLISHTPALLLDLSGVEFFGVAAFPALINVDEQCAQRGVRWAFVGSAATDLTLQVADRDHRLPAATSLVAGLEQLKLADRAGCASPPITPTEHTRC